MLHRRSWRPGARFVRRVSGSLLVAVLALGMVAVAGEWSEDFEADSGWTATGLWHRTTEDAYSPSHSYWFGQEATGDYDTGGRVEGRLTSPEIDVNGPGTIQLNFWYRRDVEWRFIQYHVMVDVTSVQVRFDHGAWGNPIWERDSGDWPLDTWRNSGFIPIVVPPGAASMQISFYFDSLDARHNAYRGWFVDDVSLDGDPIGPDLDKVSDPEIVPPDGTALTAREPGPCTTTVTCTCDTPGATIHYTRDGADPTQAAPIFPPAGLDLTVPCRETLTLKVRAYKEGMTRSNVVEQTFDCTCNGIPEGDFVRFVYLVPDDQVGRPGVVEGITRAVEDLLLWFYDDLGGHTFRVGDPVVEVFGTPHPAAWYATNPSGDPDLYFVNNTAEDGFAVTGGMFDDPDYLWVYIIDAEPDCSQEWYLGERRVVVMPRHALDGLVGDVVPVTPCPANGVGGSGEWIGLMAKLMGFALGLSEPPACVGAGPASPSCVGCDDEDPVLGCPDGALMWTGYLDYPDAFFLSHERDALRANALFAEIDPLLESWYDTFETTDGWSTSGLWHRTGATYHSMTHAYHFADPITHKYGSGKAASALDRGSGSSVSPRGLLQPVSGILTSPSIAVDGGTQVMLSFWYWREVEYFIGGEFDVTTVEVAYDRGPWEEVWRKDSTFVSRRAWVLSGALLDVPVGAATLHIRFIFDTVDAYANTFRGWVIDDVRLHPVPNGGVVPTSVTPSESMGETAEALQIQVACIPSPVTDVHTARFAVLNADVEGLMVQVFDLSGVLVWEGETQDAELVWHTESAFGSFVANGVYLYRSLVKIDGAWVDVGLSKLTVLR